MRRSCPVFWIILLVTFLVGCQSDDRRLAEMATKHSTEQARQNEEMARLNHEVAEGTKRVAETNEKLLGFQQDLQVERRQVADSYRRESLVAAVIWSLGGGLLCLLPLILCWYLLHGITGRDNDTAIAEMLVEDLVSDRPMLAPLPRADPAILDREAPAMLVVDAGSEATIEDRP